MNEPYEGRNKKQLFQNIRIGIIRKVNSDIKQDDIMMGKHSYGTLNVEWIEEGLTVSQRVPIMYPLAGDGWGIYGCPEEGDLAIGSFKTGGYPIILGYVKKSAINQLGQVQNGELVLNSVGEQQPTVAKVLPEEKNNSFIPLRPLIPGEIFIRSKQMSEIYMDRNGSFRLIAREKRTDNSSKTFTSRLFQVILGESYGDDLKTAILDKFGKIYNLYLKHIKGGSLGFNERGDLTIDVKGVDSSDGASVDLTVQKQFSFICGKSTITATKEGKISFINDSGQQIILDNDGTTVTIKDQTGNSIIMNGTTINIGSASNSFSVIGNLLITLLNNLFGLIATHTHIGVAPGSPGVVDPILTAGLPPATPITSAQILSTKVKVE